MIKLTTNEILVSDAARDFFLNQIDREKHSGVRVRVVSGAGCGGNEYDVQIVEKGAEPVDDQTLLADDLTFYIPKTDVLKLFGSKIDYVTDDLGNRRIDIVNPNEAGRCGCGISFTLDELAQKSIEQKVETTPPPADRQGA